MTEPRGLVPYDLPVPDWNNSPPEWLLATPLRPKWSETRERDAIQLDEEWRAQVTEWFIASMVAIQNGEPRPVFDASLPPERWALERPAWIIDSTPEGIAAWCLDEIAKRDDLISRLRSYIADLEAKR